MKKIFIAMMAAAALALTGCGQSIETGQVGVRTTWSGEVEQQELQQGFHTSFTSNITAYTAKLISVPIPDLKPKAADNLRLQDFDVTVYYSVNQNSIADIHVKYSSANATTESGIGLPAYALVEQLARSAANESVSKYPSMQLNDKRVELEASIKENIQKEFDRSDKGVFTIDRVNVTNILTDASVEDSIRAVAASENKRKEALNNLEVAKVQAEENRIRSQALDSKILAEKELEVLSKAKFVVVPRDFKGIITVPSN